MLLQFKKTANLVIIVLTMLIASTTFAQQDRPPKDRQQGPPPSTEQIEKLISDFADEISLRDTLKTQILALFKAHFKQVENKMNSNRKEMESLKSAFETQISKVLDEKQLEQLKNFMNKRKPRKKKPRK